MSMMNAIAIASAKVQNDLAQYEGKTTPALLKAAFPILADAAIRGDDKLYADTLKLVASSDISETLLGGPIADAQSTADTAVGLGVNAVELAALESMGLDRERIAFIEKKYDLNRKRLQ